MECGVWGLGCTMWSVRIRVYGESSVEGGVLSVSLLGSWCFEPSGLLCTMWRVRIMECGVWGPDCIKYNEDYGVWSVNCGV